MVKRQISDSIETEELIQRFNRREESAFEYIYGLLYQDLLYFSIKLFHNSDLVPQDTIQDLFMKLWIGKHISFNSLEHIKAYMYTSIRNSFREYSSHQKVKSKYEQTLQNEDDRFTSYLVETEVISELSRHPELFPKECAKVLKLYLEGWDIKDIAEKLDKSPSTIYTQRQEIIVILKKLMKRELFSLILYNSLLMHYRNKRH